MDERDTGRRGRAGMYPHPAWGPAPGGRRALPIPVLDPPNPDPVPCPGFPVPAPRSRRPPRGRSRPVMLCGRGPGARWRRSVREAVAAAGPGRRRTRSTRTARTTRRTSDRRGRSPAASAIAWAWRASCAAAAGGRGRPGPVGGGGTWRQRGARRAGAGRDGGDGDTGTPELRAVLAWACEGLVWVKGQLAFLICGIALYLGCLSFRTRDSWRQSPQRGRVL